MSASDDVFGATQAATPGDGRAVPGLAIGARIGGRYLVRAFLGEGGMGAVYRALDETLGEEVALKVVRGAVADASRLRDEVRLAQKVTHGNVCRTYDLEDVDGLHIVKMEYVAGETLAAILAREGKQPIARSIAIARAIADGLATAHAQGIVHRDLKPGNVMIASEHDRVVLMDFGLAQSVADEADASGTPGYMAPEQLANRKVDGRSDLYALGCVLYELLAGERVFPSARGVELAAHHASTPAPDVRAKRADAPRWLARATADLLAKDPTKRERGVRELQGGSQRLRTRTAVLATGAVVLAASTIAAFALRPASHFVPDVVDLPAALEGGGAIAFSPDGRDLAYTTEPVTQETEDHVVIRHADGSIDAVPGTWDTELRWTRDGRALLLARHGHVFRHPLGGGSDEDLGAGSTADDCGGGVLVIRGWSWLGVHFDLQFADGHREPLFRAPSYLVAGGPQCSPDGAHVLVWYGLTFPTGCLDDIYSIDRATRTPHQITHGHDSCMATFADDGSTIVFASRRDRAVQIYEVPAAGGEPHRVTSDDGPDMFPDVSSDGRLAFVRFRDETHIVVGAGSGAPREVPVALGKFDVAVPTHDARRLIALRATPEGFRAEDVNVATGAELELAPAFVAFPSFDDRRVYYVTPDQLTQLRVVAVDAPTASRAVATLPGDLLNGFDAADGAHVVVRGAGGGYEGWHVATDGSLAREPLGGWTLPAPSGGWRAVQRFDDQEGIRLELYPAGETTPHYTLSTVALENFWIDDHRIGYTDPSAIRVFDVATGSDARPPITRPEVWPLFVFAPDGERWFDLQQDVRVTRHIMTNFAERPR